MLFTPLDLRGVTVPNRIVRTAHGTRLTPNGLIGDELIAFHEARARSGVGLTILEIASVHPTSPGGIRAWHDDVLRGYERLMRRLGRYPMKVVQQLMHFGRDATPRTEPPWAASSIPSLRFENAVPPVAITRAQIDELVAAYASAARRVVDGGLDGIEVHAGHGLLLGQFLSPLTNLREDDYGGSPENRARLLIEVMAAVSSEVAGAVPVGVRVSADELVPGGLQVEDTATVTTALEQAGLIDFLDISVGSSFSFHRVIGGMEEPHGYQLPYATPLAQRTSVPTIVAGRIHTLDHAERIVAAGTADLVSLVRATIADPEIVEKSRRGQAHRVRPCIACNQGCVGGDGVDRDRIGCTVNATAGFEGTLTPPLRVESPRVVLVAGGGPAGMEAARVAAVRGHHVILCERTDRLGGQLSLARLAPHREAIGEIADWLQSELTELEVDVRLGTAATPAFVRDVDPGAVVVATGARARGDGARATDPRRLPGAELPHVITPREALEGSARVASAVVFDDVGHYEAIGVAEALLARGAAVTFITRLARLAPQIEAARGNGPVKSRLAELPFELIVDTELVWIGDSKVGVRSIYGGPIRELPADAVVLTLQKEPVRDLVDQIGPDVEVRIVGDALSPRFLDAAIAEGYRAGIGL